MYDREGRQSEGMPTVSFQKRRPSFSAHQGAHCHLSPVLLRSVAQALTSLRARRPDGNRSQRERAGSATAEPSHQRALASSYREAPKSGVTDRSRTLPLTREVFHPTYCSRRSYMCYDMPIYDHQGRRLRSEMVLVPHDGFFVCRLFC